MDEAYARDVLEVANHFNVNIDQGLTEDQILNNRRLFGMNEFPPEEGVPFWKLVAKQFDDLLVKILIASATISFILAILNGDSAASAFLEPGVIILILIANATVGVITETNAEKAIEELKSYEAEVATVLRNGRLSVLPASELVPGDIVEIAVGCKVPADLRLVQVMSTQLRVDQSILTGESASVEKNIDPVSISHAVNQDKICMLFSGTVVTMGRGRAIVVQTGTKTAFGKIRNAMLESVDEMTPLKKKLDEFGRFLSKVIAVICILVWIVNIQNFSDKAHGGIIRGAIYYFKIAVALAVAAIPEGLPAVVTTCLALGTKKMAKLNAIVRTLPCVETLGCTTVICSDKTGTLTTNMMSVSKICTVISPHSFPFLEEFNVTGTDFSPEGFILQEDRTQILHPSDIPGLVNISICSSLCNDSVLQFNSEKNTYEKIGESMEVALHVLSEKIGLPGFDSMPSSMSLMSKSERATFCNNHWANQFKKLSTLEFSRDRRMMSVLCAIKNQIPPQNWNQYLEPNQALPQPQSPDADASRDRYGGAEDKENLIVFSKGATESILSKSNRFLSSRDGKIYPLSPQLRNEIEQQMTKYGQEQTLRVLALAFKTVDEMDNYALTKDDENDLIFIGLVGMLDPPREGVAEAIETCRSAGIRVIVVTGDNKATAESVCRRIGVIDLLDDSESNKSLTASQFDALSSSKKTEVIRNLAVFSRVEPSHKSMLIDALRANREVVAMTGDGVNDAPALKKADIGIAMGSGTAVAKSASDMVLADDNFSTIVAAVAEGRSIYNNMKQFIRYMVSSNIGEVVCIFVAAALGLPEPLIPVQLLWVNLVTDGLPATALGFNSRDPQIMMAAPRKMNEGIVNGWLFFRYVVIGVYVGIVTIGGFIWWYLQFTNGPLITWKQLLDFENCSENALGQSCKIFLDLRPKTVSMSILVVVEMFNALNNLSENQSLFVVYPWSNLWLLSAISLSMILHFLILYIPFLAALFSVAPLSWIEWRAVLLFSFPVIIVDEILKLFSRYKMTRHKPNQGNGIIARKPRRKTLDTESD